MGANDPKMMKIVRQFCQFRNFCEFEIDHDEVSVVILDEVMELIHIASDDDLSKMGVQVSSEMLSRDTVGLSDNDSSAMHGSPRR